MFFPAVPYAFSRAEQMSLQSIEYALESLKKAVHDLESITLSASL